MSLSFSGPNSPYSVGAGVVHLDVRSFHALQKNRTIVPVHVRVAVQPGPRAGLIVLRNLRSVKEVFYIYKVVSRARDRFAFNKIDVNDHMGINPAPFASDRAGFDSLLDQINCRIADISRPL